jgi:hypothetical protein
MGMSDANDALVERIRAALRRLAEAPPTTAAATSTLAEVEAAWARRPFSIGLAGEDVFARTDLIDALCGGRFLELEGRVPGCAPVRVRRGAATRFKATRRDGTAEEMTLPTPVLPRESPHRRDEVEAVRQQVMKLELQADRAERAVPQMVRKAPPWWAFWAWIVRWFVVWRSKKRVEQWHFAKAELDMARYHLVEAEEAIPTTLGALPSQSPEQFFARLRMLCSGMIGGRDVQEVELEVTSGPLVEGVEVVELTGVAARTEVDVTVRVTTSQVQVASGESSIGRTFGPPSEAARALAKLPIEERAMWLARHAREVLLASIDKLDDEVERAEVALRNRIAHLENLKMPDAERFVSQQLARVKPQLAASILAVLEHAGVHLGSELAECARMWDALVAKASTQDELKAAAAHIDVDGPAQCKRIADETRILVVGGVGGSAHDILPELFAPLRQPGLPDEHAKPPKQVPALPPVELLPSLVLPTATGFAGELGGAGKWLTGLFRSHDARRAELREKVRQRSAHLQEVARAELLDAEPKLRNALLEAAGRELATAVERRMEWLAKELAREQLAVTAERATLWPLVKVLDDTRKSALHLNELVALHAAPRAVGTL